MSETEIEDTHKDLCKAIENGDANAFRRLFDKYYDTAFDIAIMYCNYHDAEEVIGDVFSKIWNKRTELSSISNFDSYLFVAVRNQSFNYLKKRKIDTVTLDNMFSHIPHSQVTPHHDLETKELTHVVEATINDLPPKCKEVFKLVKEDGMRYKDAANELSISENTLETHLKKATKKIMHVIHMYGIKSLFFFLLYLFEK